MARQTPKDGWIRYLPRLLLLIPLLIVVWVPFYNRKEPALFGIPFFYWYQLAGILVGAATVFAVYMIETRITHTIERPKPRLDPTGPGDML